MMAEPSMLLMDMMIVMIVIIMIMMITMIIMIAMIISNSAGRPGQQIVDFPTIMDLALRGFSEQIWGLLQNDQQDDAHPILPTKSLLFG